MRIQAQLIPEPSGFNSALRLQYNTSLEISRTSWMSPPDLAAKLAAVTERIRLAAEKCHRSPEEISLLAVSKAHGSEAVRALYQLGVTRFGENYLQEAQDKQVRLADLPIEWHFIGPLQSNKTQAVARNFAWIHSLDRLKIARRLSAQRPESMPLLNCLIQVNIDGEDSKSGINPDRVDDFAAELAGIERLQLRGLMAIPRPRLDYADQLACHQYLARLGAKLRVKHPYCDQLSMGMSADLEAAIAAGSTIVRVGTDLLDRKSTRLNSSHSQQSRMPSSA